MKRGWGPIMRFIAVYHEVSRGLGVAIMRLCAVGAEVYRGGVLRNSLLARNAILRFFAVCQDMRPPCNLFPRTFWSYFNTLKGWLS
jgi:hypothetical protein